MEHRCGRRRSLDHLITVLTGAGEPLTGIARNVSAGGIYLESLSGPLQAWEFVELLVTPDEGAGQPWRWPALVVRTGPSSAALMFDRLRFSDLHALMGWLRQQSRPDTGAGRRLGTVVVPSLAGSRLH